MNGYVKKKEEKNGDHDCSLNGGRSEENFFTSFLAEENFFTRFLDEENFFALDLC
jgi:hypothetical protein